MNTLVSASGYFYSIEYLDDHSGLASMSCHLQADMTIGGQTGEAIVRFAAVMKKEDGRWQNYPMSFNPSTTIPSSIVNTQFTILSVFDIPDRNVSGPVTEVREPGRHPVRWDASDVASGVCFYSLKARGLVDTTNLIVLK